MRASERAASLSAYVDLPMTDLVACFTDPGIDALLAAAIQDALDAEDELESVHVAPTLWASSGNLRAPVTWSVRGPGGELSEGTATISLLVVQSGHDAITEVLVSLPVADESALATTAAVRRALDELIRRLEAPVA